MSDRDRLAEEYCQSEWDKASSGVKSFHDTRRFAFQAGWDAREESLTPLLIQLVLSSGKSIDELIELLEGYK